MKSHGSLKGRIIKMCTGQGKLRSYGVACVISLLFCLGIGCQKTSDQSSTDSPAALPQTATTTYHHQNYRGDVVMITDAAGNIKAQQKYMPYGEEITPQSERKRGFMGNENDTHMQAVNFNERSYDAAIGKFLSSDRHLLGGKLIDSATVNRFAFAGNDPVNNSESGQAFIRVNNPFIENARENMTILEFMDSDFLATRFTSDWSRNFRTFQVLNLRSLDSRSPDFNLFQNSLSLTSGILAISTHSTSVSQLGSTPDQIAGIIANTLWHLYGGRQNLRDRVPCLILAYCYSTTIAQELSNLLGLNVIAASRIVYLHSFSMTGQTMLFMYPILKGPEFPEYGQNLFIEGKFNEFLSFYGNLDYNSWLQYSPDHSVQVMLETIFQDPVNNSNPSNSDGASPEQEGEVVIPFGKQEQ